MKRASQGDRQRVIDILSKSFDDNRSVNYVVKQGSNREERIRDLMGYSFDVCLAFGEVWLSDNAHACALILLPDKKRASVQALVWDVKLALSVIGLSRIGKVLSRESKIKAYHPEGPFCYLWFIGVRPEHQKNGIGNYLLKEIIEECELKKRAIYLETSVETNLPWYHKFGFEIFQTLDFSYSLYLLRRPLGNKNAARWTDSTQVGL